MGEPITQDQIIERVMRVVREEIRHGAVDTRVLRAKVKAAAAELGIAPPPDPRQMTIEAFLAAEVANG
jgi:hypothetical protein